MKKELPKIFKGNVHSNNNKKISHENKSISVNPKNIINDLFKKNHIYKQNVKIELKDKTYTTKIIGRTNEHIITIDNSVIKIDDIVNLTILNEQK